jgi:hypothetical protein
MTLTEDNRTQGYLALLNLIFKLKVIDRQLGLNTFRNMRDKIDLINLEMKVYKDYKSGSKI